MDNGTSKSKYYVYLRVLKSDEAFLLYGIILNLYSLPFRISQISRMERGINMTTVIMKKATDVGKNVEQYKI